MFKPSLVLVFAVLAFFTTTSEGSSYSWASASSSATTSSRQSHHNKTTPPCGRDEIFSNCINGGCQVKTCSEVGLPTPFCPKFDKSRCIKGCICKNGYVRDDNDVCIPKENCSSCGGDPNAKPGCGVNCGSHCSEIGNRGPVACPAICYSNGCDCKPGFVLDDNKGKCVLPKDCTPTCGNNEIFSNCSNGGCGPKSCDGLGTRIGCVKMDQKYCIGGCICKDGYLRDENDDCIPKTDCPACGGDPNAVSGCGTNCGKQCRGNTSVACTDICYQDACDCREDFLYNDITGLCVRPEDCHANCGPNETFEECPQFLCTPQNCSELGFPWPAVPCPRPEDGPCPGPAACVCFNDYVRNDQGECIPKRDCPSCGGDPNAVSGCGGNCGRKCSNYKDNDTVCPLICNINGCDCREGYVYDDNLQKCVLPCDCTPTCGVNEVYDTCVNSGCRRWNCSDSILCIDPITCEAGCSCQDGYSRDINGSCIPENQCPGLCNQPHEYYNECPTTCPPQTCESIGKIYHCPVQFIPPNCEGQCVCEKGYYRNFIGECISEENCKKCMGPHEYYTCGGACDNVCATLSEQNQTNCPIVNIMCNRMCYCEPGYARDKNNTCIPINQCPEPPCGPNERYEQCPDTLCSPQTCSQLGFPIDCVSYTSIEDYNSSCPGKPGCVCDYGYVRDDNGTCIPTKDCPSCGGDPNAVSGCGVNCGRKCSNYKDNDTVCPLICNINGCDCREGYVYDDNLQKCVLPCDCTPTCGVNEVYDTCVNGGCRRWNCSDSILCIDPITCEAGCSCQDGYSRDINGSCIPENQCPGRCNQPHEYYTECPKTCPPQTCDSIGKIYFCPLQPSPPNCKGQCVCEKGYYRNFIGECISEGNCKKCMGPHEYYSCGGACDNVCATLSEQNQTNCPIVNIMCNRMCYCEPGYARDKNNICIPIDQCTEPPCGQNERYEQCPDTLCSPQTCSQLGFPIDCVSYTSIEDYNSSCPGKPGCVCDYGFIRDDNGTCIPTKDCPSCGGDPNAVSGCGVNCGRKCSNYKDNDTVCPLICNINGCDCREGYVYDDNLQKCVLPCDCTPTCGVNEVYDTCVNGGCRRWNCSDSILCIDPITCEAGCSCQDGYSRDINGSCIPENQCPVRCNQPHECYDECPTTCPPQTCESIGKKYSCPLQTIPPNCEGQCVCEEGYYRNYIGECISEENCKKCMGPHEYYSCGGACDNVCATLSEQNQTNCPIVNIMCNRMCYCEPGYARDKNNTCIPINQCPEPQCADDEIYEECPSNLCTPQKCSELGFPLNCSFNSDDVCLEGPGCICDDGNVRDDEGNCIPKDQCPSCGGDPNAISGCGNYCGNRCSDYKRKAFCPLFCMLNGCRCRPGFVYDTNIKKCVQPENCTPTCGINEVFDTCANGGCRRWNCSQSVLCRDPIACKPGCSCLEGYTRSNNGTCIPEDQCSDRCNKPHEYYDDCPVTCPPQTCESIGKAYSCPAQLIPPECVGDCVCEKGYYRNLIGECISESDCENCTGPHEYHSCGGECDNVCATLSQQNQTNCPIDNNVCKRMCYCEPGYARDKNNICIPIDQCKEPPCGPNERYEPCPDTLCSPQTCSQLGFPIDCVSYTSIEDYNSSCPGKPGCVCDYGYIRDDNGSCIPTKNCPSCGGDPNAVSGCGINCGRLCSNFDKGPVPCPKICKINSCDCRKGFVFDQNIGKCVRPKQCTPICNRNEVYSECVNGGCQRKNCSQLGKDVPCIKMDPAYCIKGCLCKENYLRADNGTCVPEDQCSKRCTGPHEYFSCGGACDNVCATLYRQNQTHCPIINKRCNSMCYCQKEYARNDKNICTPINQCQVGMCGPNERYEEKPSLICEPLKCSELGFPLNCSSDEDTTGDDKPACICKEGYVRDDNGLCVPVSQCPSCGGDCNAVAGCGVNCGKTCSTYGKDVSCIAVCYTNACDCRDGFVYDDVVKKCVKYEDCCSTEDVS